MVLAGRALPVEEAGSSVLRVVHPWRGRGGYAEAPSRTGKHPPAPRRGDDGRAPSGHLVRRAKAPGQPGVNQAGHPTHLPSHVPEDASAHRGCSGRCGHARHAENHERRARELSRNPDGPHRVLDLPVCLEVGFPARSGRTSPAGVQGGEAERKTCLHFANSQRGGSRSGDRVALGEFARMAGDAL